METQQIIIGSIVTPVIGWILLNVIQQRTQIATLRSGHNSIIASLNDSKDDIKGVRQELIKIDTKINLFLKSEIDTMKEIARENTRALNRLSDK